MLDWWRHYLSSAKSGGDVRSIRFWGTVGNKTDIVAEWISEPLQRYQNHQLGRLARHARA
jgi:hypothetical protein